MLRLAAALLLMAVVAGCGGGAVPEGTPVSVRFEIVNPPGWAGPPGVGPLAQPFAVHETQSQWTRISRLLPDRLPEPVDDGTDCFSGDVIASGQVVSVRVFTSGGDTREVDYGPCRWPEAIEPVRLLMHTLLRRRLAAERRCECP